MGEILHRHTILRVLRCCLRIARVALEQIVEACESVVGHKLRRIAQRMSWKGARALLLLLGLSILVVGGVVVIVVIILRNWHTLWEQALRCLT